MRQSILGWARGTVTRRGDVLFTRGSCASYEDMDVSTPIIMRVRAEGRCASACISEERVHSHKVAQAQESLLPMIDNTRYNQEEETGVESSGWQLVG